LVTYAEKWRIYATDVKSETTRTSRVPRLLSSQKPGKK